MHQPQPVHPSAEALKQGYEPEGVHIGALLGILLSIAVSIAIFMGISYFLILALTRHYLAIERVPSDVIAAKVKTGLPPLQPSPSHDTIAAEDLVAFRKHEMEVFGSLGWKPAGPENQPRVPDAVIAAVAAKEPPIKGGR